MITPRDYQIEAAASLWNYFLKKTGNPVVVMPTGTGKSIVIALFLYWVYQAYFNQRVLVVTHVKELIEQNHKKLLALWPNAPAGIYSAGLQSKDLYSPIIFAGIASIFKLAAQLGKVDLVIVDEVHMVNPTEQTMYNKFFAALKEINPNIKFIGLTATDYRLGHGKITDKIVEKDGNEKEGVFTDVCFNISGMEAFNRLIAEGYLAPLIPKHTKTVLQIDGVHTRGGEFLLSELQDAVDRDDITEAALREAMEVGSDRQSWLIFCAGVEHSINAARILSMLGIPCEAIHSNLKSEERDRIIGDFKSGRLRAVTNNNVLTTGFDHPPVDLIIMLRPTKSTVLWVQMLGRGTRPYDPARPGEVDPVAFPFLKENCLVLDYAGNTRRLGPINDPLIPKKKGEKVGEAPVKLCGQCSTWNHASLRFCCNTECGHEFVIVTKLKNKASTIELIKGEEPITKIFKVDHITYTAHYKAGAKPSMKVTYYCGLHMYMEFVCIEYEGFALRKAKMWWRERTDMEMLTTVEETLNAAELLLTPTHLKVWVNKKYPEILKCCYDGTAFGTTVPQTEYPTVKSEKIVKFNAALHANQAEDDDIPF